MTIGSVTVTTRELRGSHLAKSTLGFLLCVLGALVFCLMFRGTATVASMPIVFLVPITLIAMHFGRLCAALGTCAAGFLFAMYLFEPIGQLQIANAHQRSYLGYFLLFGIIISIASWFVADDEPELDKVKRP